MPTVSFQTISGAFDSSDNLLAPALVQSLEDGASLLTFAFSVEGEIPEGGLEVTVNSDIALLDYFLNLGYKPFSPGGEVLEAVYEDAKATGFKFRIDEPNAIINLAVRDDGETNGPTQATFTLEAGEDYTVSPDADASTVTFYDTLDLVPAPTVTPEVSLSVSNTALDESTGNTTTLTFTLSDPPPSEGVIVYVRGAGQPGGEGDPTGRDLADFDIYNAKIAGGVFPASNFAANGFYFKITEQTATITLPAFADEAVEGIEEFTFSLQETPGYTINPESGSVTLTVVDNPESQIQVSLSTEPYALIESEGTVSVHKFSLSATPPEGGVTVSVSAPNLSEFNLGGIEVVGGEIVAVRDDGFDFKITAKEATIELPVADDGVDEGLEAATFTLEAGEGYQINADTSSGSFQIVDTPEQAPPDPVVSEPNDTLEKAFDTRLSSFNPSFSATSRLDFDFDNSYPKEDGSVTYVDATEDVDIYKVSLKAGDTIYIDTDANQYGPGRKVDPGLRVFDATGKELAENEDGAAPDEFFTAKWESYVEFTAPTDGDYYVGASLYFNRKYDPNTPGSGTGGAEDEFGADPEGYGPGEYTINISLNEPIVPDATVIPPGSSDGPEISLQTLTYTFDAAENLLAPAIVESVEPEEESGGPALSFVLSSDQPIPEGGLIVYVNSDRVLTDYFFGEPSGDKPFAIGGEVLEAIYNEAGEATGFKFRLDRQNAIINLNPLTNQDADGPKQVTYSVVPSEGYSVDEATGSATVTFYDTLEQVPTPTVIPQVGMTVDKTELIESEGTIVTLTFSLSEAPPPEGTIVYVKSEQADSIGEFDIFATEVTGGVFPNANGSATGFFFKILEQSATITLPVFNSADLSEGIEQYSFSLQEIPGYTIDPNASSFDLTLKDTPDSQLQVSLATEPEVLVESEGTVAKLNFSLSAPPPQAGVTVTVSAPNLVDFDPESLTATGGELVGAAPDNSSFTFKITEQNASVSLAVANDGEAEGLEEVTFTVEPGGGFQVNPEANSGTFTLVDTPELLPPSTEESNDTLETAIATGLSAANPSVTFEGEISYHTDVDQEGNNINEVDATEDVDLYKVNLLAGQTLAIDVDAAQLGSKFQYSQLRVFDAEGKELAKIDFEDYGVAPDEVFEAIADPYLEFTPETDGTYYVGVSQIGNDAYDPSTIASGSGWVFPDFGIDFGEYTLNLNLELDGGGGQFLGGAQADEFDAGVSPEGFNGSNNLVFAGGGDDLLDTSAGGGNNRLYGQGGSDTFILGSDDRAFGDAGDDRFFALGGGNVLTGGTGTDQFWIASGETPETSNTIADFEVGTDVLGIGGLGLSFEDLTLTQQNGNTAIAAGEQELAKLLGINSSSLSADNFVFG